MDIPRLHDHMITREFVSSVIRRSVIIYEARKRASDRVTIISNNILIIQSGDDFHEISNLISSEK